jgi:archaellum component FlaG (FlaF/FlaG flagellin family)
MNRLLMIIIIACTLFSCDIRKKNGKADVAASDPSAQVFKDSTTVQIIDSVYDFGKVTDGEKVEYNYRFKNTGKNSLIVTNTSASCGCTVPEKPEQPIKPGETGFIKVVFNSKGRVGEAHKEVTVISNAYPGFPILQLKGEVTEVKK